MSDDTTTLVWEVAFEEAVVPKDSDAEFEKLLGRKILAPDGSRIVDVGLIRERAALRYAEAHEGKDANVYYTNPDREGVTYAVSASLTTQVVNVPVFTDDPSVTGTMRGLVVGENVVPLAGITEMRAKGDNGGVANLTR